MDTPSVVDYARVAAELGIGPAQVQSVVALADEGNTVPFITRYRKEHTGNLDEVQIRAVLERVGALRQLAERATTILRLIETQGQLTPELRAAIEQADSLKRLEDLYLPYKPKKRTRAAAARERGLEPLSSLIWSQSPELVDLETAAAAFVDPERELPAVADVLQGAADILAERFSEDADVRAAARRIAWKSGRLTLVAVDAAAEAGQAYRDYFNHSEPVTRVPPHRVLAFNRGEKEGALRVRFEWDEPLALSDISRQLGLPQHRFTEFVTRCATDALSRLIEPSLEREIRRELTERAERHAVSVFARNLRNLLLQPPLQGRRVLAIDPGFRTGCKTVVLDETGKVLANDLIYVTGPAEKRAATKAKVAAVAKTHDCSLIVIGNGTACRETEELIAEMITELAPDLRYLIVNEAGASIYSTSAVAREEFPDDDATVRGTISIGRRVQDPLSELVKIEPQHIGVGLYQHDINHKLLRESLDQVIESCVNYVGVDLNTASASLLSYVSGLNQLNARRVVEWRTQNGAFKSRAQLLQVSGVGQATYTQAAGFLKIRDADEPLDETWIHPESYATARQLLAQLSAGDDEPLPAGALRERLAGIAVPELARELNVGVPTLNDIIDALVRPGRDPRADLPGPIFKKGILKMDDLQPGMELQGTVLNVVDFGAFVDIGLKESGLVHISQMSTQFIQSPHDAVSVGDVVTVWVTGVDQARKRVSLTMVRPGTPSTPRGRKSPSEPKPQSEPVAPANGPAAATVPAVPRPHVPTPPAQATPAPEKPAGRNQRPARKPDAERPPLSSGAKNGTEPLTSFGQLKQLWNDRSR